MGKKKLAWFLVVTFMAFVSYGNKLCLAEKNEDSLAIKMTIKRYLNGYTSRDLDSMMKEVSLNYLGEVGDSAEDYAKFKSRIENVTNDFYKKYKSYIIGEVSLSNLNIQSEKADVEVEFGWQGIDIGTSKEESGKKRRAVSLVKEKGAWKIVRYKKID